MSGRKPKFVSAHMNLIGIMIYSSPSHPELSRKHLHPVPAPPPPRRVPRTTKRSKNTVRTGVFVGHAVRYPINSVPKPGTESIRSEKKIRTKVFFGQRIRWTGGGGGRTV